MKLKFKKRGNPKFKTAIIAGVVSFFLFLPNVAQGFFLQIFKKGAEMSAVAIARGALTIITQFIFDLLNWLVRAGGAFFDGMLKIGFTSHLDIVKVGWEVTRDFSNMFFILFMVIIAFATILRTEKYGIKQLLPKIILIALLINFSLVICSVIIDFSNVAANFFIKDINQTTGKGGVSGNFVDSLNLFSTHTVMECEKLPNEPVWPADGTGPPGPSLQEQCIESRTTPAAAQIGSDVITFAISMTVGALTMLIAAFVLFAGGVMLLIRIVIIWFLVILVPFVFVCYIMPALRENWQKWWKTFLQWCFFAPAYAFFIWLAMKISLEAKTQELAKTASGEFVDVGPLANIFLSTPANALIHYLFIIALLLGGLITASKFGMYGADTAMNIAQKAKQGTVNWAKRTSMRPVKVAGTAVGAGALTTGGKLFGGKLGRRMQARAVQLRQAAEERPEHKKYAALLKRMSPHDKLEEMETKGIRGFMAAKEVASDPKLVRTISAQKAGLVMDKLRKFGEHQAADKLEEVRGDAIKDKTEQEKVVQKVTQEGNLNKIPAIALKDERLIAAIIKFASAAQIESLRKVSPQHTDNLKDALDRTTTSPNYTQMKNKGIDPHTDKIQHAYASQTGDVRRFVTKQQKIDWAKKAGPEGLKRMNTMDFDVALNIPVAQLKNTLEKMENDTVAKDIVAHLKATPGAAAHDLATNDPYISNLG